MSKSKWLLTLLSGFFLISGWYSHASAGNVHVEEVVITLYNKPVTGYRVVLDKNKRFLSDQIIKHVAASNSAKPFQFDRTIIYENIEYHPITIEKEISLYYILKSLPGQATEMTVVAMYDYKRSVSSKEFPDLSINLEIDLARLIRRSTGDILKSNEFTFDEETIEKLQSGELTAYSGKNDDPFIEHFQEEEVENENVIIHNDPFKKGNAGDGKEKVFNESGNPQDTTVIRLVERIRELERKEKEFLIRENELKKEQKDLERKNEILLTKIGENKELRDSIEYLNARVDGLSGQYYISDDMSVSSETAERISKLERALEKNMRLVEDLKVENDSLIALSKRTARQIKEVKTEKAKMVDQVIALETENLSLQEELKKHGRGKPEVTDGGTGLSSSEKDSLQNLLYAQQNELKKLKSDLSFSNSTNSRLSSENEQLKSENTEMNKKLASNEHSGSGSSAEIKKLKAEITESNEVQADLRRQVSTLQSRIRELESQKPVVSNQNENDIMKAKTVSDSLRLELIAAEMRENELKARVHKLENEQLIAKENTSNADKGTNEKLIQKDKEIASLNEDKKNLIKKIQDINAEKEEAEKSKTALNSNIASLKTELSSAKTELENEKKRNAQLNNQIKNGSNNSTALNNEINELKASLNQEKSKNANTEKKLRDYQSMYAVQQNRVDTLQAMLHRGNEREKVLRLKVSDLTLRLDSLNRANIPTSNEQEFIREQWTKLQKWEKELGDKEKEAKNREKIVVQKEASLNARKLELDTREKNLQGLEERERIVKAKEQQLKVIEGVSGTETIPSQVESGKIVEHNKLIPVYSVKTDLSYKSAQRQIVAYMLNRGEILDEKFPDIIFRNIKLLEISDANLTMKVRISAVEKGTEFVFSFQSEGGAYLGDKGDAAENSRVAQLITNMMRFSLK